MRGPRIQSERAIVPSKRLRKKLANREYKCEVCGNFGIHFDKPLTLQVDHRDGDRFNNSDDNLRWLCPNCHSQTDTFAKPKNRHYKGDLYIKLKCKFCKKLFETNKRSHERKLEDGQTNFFCSLQCRAGTTITDQQVIDTFKETNSFRETGRRLGVTEQSVHWRLKKIRERQKVPSNTFES